MLSGRGLCDGLITRPEESYRLWCVVVCDLENLKNEEAIARDWAARAIGGEKRKDVANIQWYNRQESLTIKCGNSSRIRFTV